ncbi:sigma-70 family RNA polymerase sigma factor [Streptomyces bambusae]|uniref:sigma-70 family RNA polymerase sigma factor n=1 Tax=Streptomyces bambusae TaxID=1550616 RepID=UPI001CFF2CAC|nr:sigma-70 family RNA polymerase sigma factor [Streptomyces bambusae]MCB5164070.1 sigma-70 family RNA polymerase sigma factor [Streptomyces bambusae]
MTPALLTSRPAPAALLPQPAPATTGRAGRTSAAASRTATAPAATARPADEDATRWAMAARTGDPEAVEQFVRALQRDVRRYVAYLSADPQAADDLTQETFLRALGSLHRFEGRSSARTWLLSIARRTVVDSIRHVAARPRLADTDDWQSAAERAQARGLPGFEDGVALAELLGRLPDERREAFVLTQLVGLPYAEAAEVARCPVGTVRSRVARARTALVALLRDAETAAC